MNANETDATVPYDNESAMVMDDQDTGEEDDDDDKQRPSRPQRQVSTPKVLTYNQSGEPTWERRTWR